MKRLTMTALAVLAIAGCAAVTVPPTELASSEASIRGAEEMGASGVPSAKLHLQLARDQTDEAKRMAAGGDRRAGLVLARADSDAELALGLAREVKVHAEALRATEALAALHARANP